MLYHINPNSGEAGKCSATKGGCPFGGDGSHFTSQEAARNHFEASQASFAAKKRSDLSQHLPEWHGKLFSASIEAKVADELNADFSFLEAVRAGEIETRFATLEEFLTPPIYATRSRGTYITTGPEDRELEDGTFMLAIHSRQGGGNRECFCETTPGSHEPGCLAENNEELESHPQFFLDEDDDWDTTYITHYFKAGLTQADVDKANEQTKLLAKAKGIEASRDLISSGKMPPWGVLTQDRSNLQKYRTLEGNYLARAAQAPQAKVKEARITKGMKALKDGVELSDVEYRALAKDAEVGQHEHQIKRFQEEARTLIHTNKELEKAKARTAQASALPESELKDYLLGDRGTGSYNVTEKVKRRNVSVTKTYERGTLLGKEEEEARERAGRARKYLEPTLSKLTKARDEAVNLREDLKKIETDMKAQRARAWSDGWPGLIRDIPPAPETF